MRSTRDTQYDNSQTEAQTHTYNYILSQALARVLYGVLVSVSLPPLVIVVAQERQTVIGTAV